MVAAFRHGWPLVNMSQLPDNVRTQSAYFSTCQAAFRQGLSLLSVLGIPCIDQNSSYQPCFVEGRYKWPSCLTFTLQTLVFSVWKTLIFKRFTGSHIWLRCSRQGWNGRASESGCKYGIRNCWVKAPDVSTCITCMSKSALWRGTHLWCIYAKPWSWIQVCACITSTWLEQGRRYPAVRGRKRISEKTEEALEKILPQTKLLPPAASEDVTEFTGVNPFDGLSESPSVHKVSWNREDRRWNRGAQEFQMGKCNS